MLSVVSKVYGKVLMKRIRQDTAGMICDDQHVSKKREEMHGPNICRKTVCEKYLAKNNYMYWTFMNLDKGRCQNLQGVTVKCYEIS